MNDSSDLRLYQFSVTLYKQMGPSVEIQNYHGTNEATSQEESIKKAVRQSLENVERDHGTGYTVVCQGAELLTKEDMERGLALLNAAHPIWQVDEQGLPTPETMTALFGTEGTPERAGKERLFLEQLAQKIKTQ